MKPETKRGFRHVYVCARGVRNHRSGMPFFHFVFEKGKCTLFTSAWISFSLFFFISFFFLFVFTEQRQQKSVYPCFDAAYHALGLLWSQCERRVELLST